MAAAQPEEDAGLMLMAEEFKGVVSSTGLGLVESILVGEVNRKGDAGSLLLLSFFSFFYFLSSLPSLYTPWTSSSCFFGLK
jgi:hypothetical protein